MKTKGNTILITGAGTGIGLECARVFSQNGNKVIMVARNGERLEKEASALDSATTFVCDLAVQDQLDALVQHVKDEHPDLNVVLLNAGVTNNYQLFDGVDASEHARDEMTTNYQSAVYLTQRLEPVLAANKEPAFILTTSGAALVPDITNPTYSASKAALHSFAQTARATLLRKDSAIKVFEVMAPLVDSPFAKDVKSDAKIPPKDVADAILVGMEDDEYEMHVGVTKDVYAAYLKSPEDALKMVTSLVAGEG